MHHPTDRIAHTTACVTRVVDHWLEREIAQWVQPHEGSIRRPIGDLYKFINSIIRLQLMLDFIILNYREYIPITFLTHSCFVLFLGNPATPYGRVKQFLKNLVIIMLPVLLLTGLIASTFISTLSNYSKSSKVRRTLLYSVELGRLIHYLQVTRKLFRSCSLDNTEEPSRVSSH